MKALIVGYGSIGTRHANILNSLGCKVAIVSRRSIAWDRHYFSLADAIFKEEPHYVVVANRTSEHYETINELISLNYKGIVLVEKPLFNNENIVPLHSFKKLFVAYNLRFHPGLQKLKRILENQTILCINVYTGQYLPSWRPHTNYMRVYSAKKQEGGGVLRDLSHELDYINWLTGGWESLTALGGKVSSLNIDSDDVYSILLKTKKCPSVSIHINYLDRVPARNIIVNTNQSTIKLDMIEHTLQVDEEKEHFKVFRDLTYLRQHSAILQGDFSSLCGEEEALEVMTMIRAIEEANEKRSWIKR